MENLYKQLSKVANVKSVTVYEDNNYFSCGHIGIYNIRSVTKSFTSLAIGILIDQNRLSLETPIMEFFKNIKIYDNSQKEKLEKVKIKHLLTFTTGQKERLLFKAQIKTMPKDKTYTEFILNQPIVNEPGEKFLYTNSDSYLLANIVQIITNMSLADFVKINIFDKLKINEFKWGKSVDGINFGATNLYLDSISLAKIGKMIMDKGKYNNQIIVSENYIENMCSKKVDLNLEVENTLQKKYYGYNMWSDDNYIFNEGIEGQYLILDMKNKRIVTVLSENSDINVMAKELYNYLCFDNIVR